MTPETLSLLYTPDGGLDMATARLISTWSRAHALTAQARPTKARRLRIWAGLSGVAPSIIEQREQALFANEILHQDGTTEAAVLGLIRAHFNARLPRHLRIAATKNEGKGKSGGKVPSTAARRTLRRRGGRP